MNRKSCEGCYYHRQIGCDNHEKYCHFLIDTGEPRGCPADKCTRYTKEPLPDPALFLAAIGRTAESKPEQVPEEDKQSEQSEQPEQPEQVLEVRQSATKKNKRGRASLSDETVERIRRLYMDGCTHAEISEKTGVCLATLCKYLKGYRSPLTPAVNRPKERIPAETVEEIIRLRAEGWSYHKISARKHVPVSTVYRIAKGGKKS